MSISHGIDAINFTGLTKVTISQGIVNLDNGQEITRIALSSLTSTEKISLQEGLKSYAIMTLNLSKQPDTLVSDEQITDLTNWIIEKSDSSEFHPRLRAATIIIQSAYNPKNALLHLDNLGLTSLPSIIGDLAQLKVLNIKGNYLTQYPEEILSKLPLLENKDEIRKEITRQTKIYESPHLASTDLFVKANEDLPSTLLSEKMLSAKICHKQTVLIQSPLHLNSQSTFYLNLIKKIDQFIPNVEIPATSAKKICFVAFIVLCPVINLFAFPLLFRHLKDQKDAYIDNLKALSNISGIKKLERFYMEKMLARASKAIQACDVPLEIKSEIHSAIDLAHSSSSTVRDYLQKIQEGHIVFLPIGYISKKGSHAAMIVIYQDKMIICNRGDRLLDESIYEYYQIDPSSWNEELIFNILNLQSFEKDSLQEGVLHQSLYYYKALPKALKAQKLLLPEEMSSKNQSIGNCSIASIKAAVQASCFLFQGGTKKPAIHSKKYKKSFTLSLRKQAVESVSGRLNTIFSCFFGSSIISEARNKIKKHEQKLKQLQTD